MAWTTNDLYKLVQKLTRTNQSGRLSATDFFYLWNAEQHAYFSDLLGRWQARGNGKTGANTGLLLNEVVQSELAPFLTTSSLPITGGVVTKPADFALRIAARIGAKPVTFIRHGQLNEVVESVLDAPSVTAGTYYGLEYGSTLTLLPSTVTGSLQLDYLAVPVDLRWGFTLDSSGMQLYDAASSVQPKWATPVLVTITKRALKSIGVSLKDADFVNYGASATQTGD